MTKVKSKSTKQLYTLKVVNKKQQSFIRFDSLASINVYLNFWIFSDCFVKLLNLFYSEMQNGKNEFFNFSVLILKVFNEIWLLFPFK